MLAGAEALGETESGHPAVQKWETCGIMYGYQPKDGVCSVFVCISTGLICVVGATRRESEDGTTIMRVQSS